jgi:sporulation protein YlmC with PRC-barrel domain
MTEATEFIIGSKVACSDGPCGELGRVVIDPIARAITHLVVEPGQGHAGGRLVPVELASSAAEEIELRCTRAEFGALEEADESQFLPRQNPALGYEHFHTYTMPYYGWGMNILSRATAPDHGRPDPQQHTYDHVPVGDVEVRRGDHVDATDGAIGRVEGLVVDSDHQVTHILLQDGHLWGEKTVAIPIGAVTRVGEIIRLSLTKDQVRDLPPVDVQHPDEMAG